LSRAIEEKNLKFENSSENGLILLLTCRFLMRRDQVLKICLNHRLTADLQVLPKEKDDRSFVWSASDFSEGEMQYEKFALRFKTADIASKFQTAVAQAQAELSGGPSAPTTPLKNESMVAQAGTPFTVSKLSLADQNGRHIDCRHVQKVIMNLFHVETISSTTSNETPVMKSFSFAQATTTTPQSAFSLGTLFGSPQSSQQGEIVPNWAKRISFIVVITCRFSQTKHIWRPAHTYS
jgi:hypothetical protein